jgi:hypothetical protein
VSREQLRDGSSLSNRNSDSTTAGECVTVKHGLRKTYAAARPGLLGTPGLVIFPSPQSRPEAVRRLVDIALIVKAKKRRKTHMISALIGVLIIVVIGAICFWAIDRFAPDRRLAQLLRLLVILICLAAILQRVLPLFGIYI